MMRDERVVSGNCLTSTVLTEPPLYGVAGWLRRVIRIGLDGLAVRKLPGRVSAGPKGEIGRYSQRQSSNKDVYYRDLAIADLA
jgi:hypothetical protein